ncbi:hypothetical protein GCM10008025_34520 [Ornithinibacillus halotolerans]|uniref:Uncharacterized protein n=1 Tax=Ornithinibacillus halotolerans TaxID=1274357 RepID=A0A916WDM6_9BACI|nr:hypothetical protein GCM10008025_34520 [Ornithinibacillus halotolerans]
MPFLLLESTYISGAKVVVDPYYYLMISFIPAIMKITIHLLLSAQQIL